MSFAAVTLLLGVVVWGTLSRRPPSSPASRPASGPVVEGDWTAPVRPSSSEPSASGSSGWDSPSDSEPALEPPAGAGDAGRVDGAPATAKLGAIDGSTVAVSVHREPQRPRAWEGEEEGDGAGVEASDLAPVTVLENHRVALRRYAARLGGNPVGDNTEITAALRGANARGARFLTVADGLRVNAAGESVDPWGTPWFYHQISGTEMEVRSAGPDRRLWTGDDLVMK